MGMFKKGKQAKTDATQPLQTEETQEDTALDVQAEDASETPEEEEVDDRSAYNCPDCKGEGLVFEGRHGKFCQTCHGTGKIN